MTEISKIVKNYSLENQNPSASKEKLKEVADLYEKHFLKEMIKQMKSTRFADEGLFKKNNAEKIFEEQLDDEYSKEWSKTGTFGLSDMIYKQLLDRYGSELDSLKSVEKPSGPIELNKSSEMIQIEKEKNNIKELSFQFNQSDEKQNQVVSSPWAGTLHQKQMMNDGTSIYKIKHDNGLESLISMQGAASEKSRNLSMNDKLQAGQEIGLAKITSPLFWTVRFNKDLG